MADSSLVTQLRHTSWNVSQPATVDSGGKRERACVRECVRACVYIPVCAFVRTCVRASVCVCVCG